MWENILAILVILVLSAFFRQTTNNSFNTQMLFILLSLVGLVFYKILYLNKMRKNKDILVLQNRENFVTSQENTITNFVNNNSTTPATETVDLEQTINNLQIKLENLESNISELQNNSINTNKTSRIDDMITSQSVALKQADNHLRELYKKQVEQTSLNDKDYPSIPLYSSCIVEGADGTPISESTVTQTVKWPDININVGN